MNVTFACPACDAPARVVVDRPVDWQCRSCGYEQQISKPDGAVNKCLICANPELYKKKDFSHRLGMTILVVACVTSVFTYMWYQKWLTWAILIGSALVDGILYLLVGDVVVCYRCNGHHRGLESTEKYEPYELTIAERYRQERIRREQLQSSARESDSGLSSGANS